MTSSGSGGDKPKRKTPTKRRSALEYQGEYDPANFVVPASDSKGHSARAIFRLPVSMQRQVQLVRSSGLFPFGDDSDVYRWCVREGLAILDGMEEVPNSVFGQAEAALSIAQEYLYQKEYATVFETMDQAMESVRQQGGFAELRRFYARVKSQFEKMPEGYWRTYYLGTLARKYLHLVDPAANRKRLEEEAAAGPLRLGLGAEDEEEVG